MPYFYQMGKNSVEVLLHLLFWALGCWILNEAFVLESVQELNFNGVVQTVVQKNYTMFLPIAFGLIGKAALAYIHAFFLLPRFLKNKKRWIYGAGLLAALAFSFGLEASLNSLYHLAHPAKKDWLFFPGPGLNFLLNLLFLAVSGAYVLAKNHIRDQKVNQQLRQEKLTAELNFLKSQVNPHFLFNTLNNLYTIAERGGDTELSGGIAGLAGLMRYMLQDAKADRVPLEKEVAYLQNVLEIHQLRLEETDNVLVAFNVQGALTGAIAPLILVPFVENAFKHGIRYKENSFVKIDFRVTDNRLYFTVVNSLFPEIRSGLETPSGLGLENVKRRLALQYPDKHHLEIHQETTVFKVLLELELNDQPG